MKAKLWIHQPNFSDEEIVLNAKDFPNIRLSIGDVVEIRDPELESFSPLLLQVKSFTEQSQLKDGVVSISQAIAGIFHLRTYSEVEISVINSKDVALGLVELTYKEQYLSRADMQRLKESLTNTCLYITKKVKHAEMRVQVHELWSRGDKVSCGYVTEDTRITFRSYCAQVNIFIQMSSEMWEFDNYGDLYFEKAVDGFLVDLFNEWKEKGCGHDVTITLFSRTFYDAKRIEDFPMCMRECVQMHSSGYFCEDFYRVVVQNEKYDDWTKTLIELRKLFHEYNDKVVNYHKQQGQESVPASWNSSAAEGNFMEVLNMSLNVFEKFYLDRCFDRTGKLSTVITPGPGVFEVDRKLASITKHRTIDCGSSSDLVCMGEQPLHVVPLFKYTSKLSTTQDDYHIPHWINHSFYTSKSQENKLARGVFIPRIRMPENSQPWKFQKEEGTKNKKRLNVKVSSKLPSDEVPFLDYDEYDAQIFKIPYKPIPQVLCNSYQAVKAKRVPRCAFSKSAVNIFGNDTLETRDNSSSLLNGEAEFMPHSYGGHESHDRAELMPPREVAGSLPEPVKYQRPASLNNNPRKALFNPFTPSRLRFKVTSNRRRWAHAFPTDSQGDAVQLHHKSSGTLGTEMASSGNEHQHSHSSLTRRPRERKISDSSDYVDHNYRQVIVSSIGSQGSSESTLRERYDKEFTISFKESKTPSDEKLIENDMGSLPRNTSKNGHPSRATPTTFSGIYSRSSSIGREFIAVPGEKDDGINSNWVWGLSGEQEWTPEIKTGVDWKSMTIPASLPITTDYFPDKHSLETDYVFKNYTLLPDDINSDSKADKSQQLSTAQVYKEMVAQRLAHGFQIVMLSKHATSSTQAALSSSPYQGSSSLRRRTKVEPTEETIVSIGSIFHRLSLTGPKITATTYWPKHPYPAMNSHYTYRFRVPDSERYEVSWTDFSCSRLETYNWNHVDIYLCTKGEDPNFDLVESLMYWRSHFVLLPCNNPATRAIIEGAERCDIYQEPTITTQQQRNHDFLRFVEMLNKLRRPTQSHMHGKKELGRKSSITVSPVIPGLSMDRPGEATSTTKKSVGKLPEGMETPPVGSFGISGTPVESSLRRITVSMADVGNLSSTARHSSKAETMPVLSAQSDAIFPENASLCEVAAAMLDSNGGLYFVKQQNQQQQNQFGPSILPNNCFVADEAIAWVKSHVEGVTTHALAVAYLQKMLDEQLICHASGNDKHKFIQGFYLYYFCNEKKGDMTKAWSGYFRNREFEQEWMEVTTHCPEEGEFDESPVPVFLHDTIETLAFEVSPLYDKTSFNYKGDSSVYRNVNCVVDPLGKSDRQEWGTGMYHANYTPKAAFELTIKWLSATGCILGDLIQSWSRRAGQYGFHFLPAPGDPFALPFTPGSDPLRGPIFIPLNMQCLKARDVHLFEDFPAETRDERLVLFQESILKRFGFMMDKCPLKKTRHGTLLSESQPNYVHCSGGMFAMIPDTKRASPKNRDGTHLPQHSGGSLKEYIALQAGASKSKTSSCVDQGSFYQVGFLWAWNFMLSKRWRSPNTGDESYQDKMLEDFRAFCSNQDNRLETYWNGCWQEYESFKHAPTFGKECLDAEGSSSQQERDSDDEKDSTRKELVA